MHDPEGSCTWYGHMGLHDARWDANVATDVWQLCYRDIDDMACDIAHWHMADMVGLMWHYPMSACGPCG